MHSWWYLWCLVVRDESRRIAMVEEERNPTAAVARYKQCILFDRERPDCYISLSRILLAQGEHVFRRLARGALGGE